MTVAPLTTAAAFHARNAQRPSPSARSTPLPRQHHTTSPRHPNTGSPSTPRNASHQAKSSPGSRPVLNAEGPSQRRKATRRPTQRPTPATKHTTTARTQLPRDHTQRVLPKHDARNAQQERHQADSDPERASDRRKPKDPGSVTPSAPQESGPSTQKAYTHPTGKSTKAPRGT